MNQTMIDQAAKLYPRNVTGPYAGCQHPAAVLQWVLTRCSHEGCRHAAENFVRTKHGACWNAMVENMPANGWLVWYTGKLAAAA